MNGLDLKKMRIFLSLLSLLLFACGTFQLASGIHPPAGKTKDQQQVDMLICKDQAKLAANTPAKQTGAFLLGATIIGAPVAYEMEKSTQRKVFAECMTKRGYIVDPPRKSTASQRPTKNKHITAAQDSSNNNAVVSSELKTTSSSGEGTQKQDDFIKLEKLKKLKDSGIITKEEYSRKKKEILDRM